VAASKSSVGDNTKRNWLIADGDRADSQTDRPVIDPCSHQHGRNGNVIALVILDQMPGLGFWYFQEITSKGHLYFLVKARAITEVA
jgi:hypothetical protein